jgi:hypothetical protein
VLGDPQEDVDPSLCGPGSVPSLECQARMSRMSRGLRSENPCCVSPALLEPSITLYACRMPAVPCHRRSSALARQQCPSVGPMAARRGGDLRLPTAQVAYLSIPPTLAHCNRLSRPPRPDMCIIAKVNTCTPAYTGPGDNPENRWRDAVSCHSDDGLVVSALGGRGGFVARQGCLVPERAPPVCQGLYMIFQLGR